MTLREFLTNYVDPNTVVCVWGAMNPKYSSVLPVNEYMQGTEYKNMWNETISTVGPLYYIPEVGSPITGLEITLEGAYE